MPDYGSTSSVPDAFLTGSSYGRAAALDEPGASTPPLASAATNVQDAMSAYRAGNLALSYSLTQAGINVAAQLADADARAFVSSARGFNAALSANGYRSSADLDVMASELAQTAADVYQIATQRAEPGVNLADLEADQAGAIMRQESADEIAATRGAIIDSALTNPVSSGLASIGNKIIDTAKKVPDVLSATGGQLGAILNLLPLLLVVVALFVLWRLFGR